MRKYQRQLKKAISKEKAVLNYLLGIILKTEQNKKQKEVFFGLFRISNEFRAKQLMKVCRRVSRRPLVIKLRYIDGEK